MSADENDRPGLQVVQVRELGLAAYIKVNGAKLVGLKDRMFQLETDRPLADWRLEYNNSCCQRHDASVCELRLFLRNSMPPRPSEPRS